MIQLNVVEARVLGSLMEKELTTPEYYPLSLNALVNACNQKSSREPVMQLSETDVRGALFSLEELKLTRTLADGRVSKFEHRTRDGLNLRRDEFAVVCLLLLRGPQTTAELRARAERMYTFDDNAAVLTTLERMSTREDALTVQMQRQPGARESRWMHLLCGPVSDVVVPGSEASPRASASSAGGGSSALQARIEALEEAMRASDEMLLAVDERLRSFDERLLAIEEKMTALEGFTQSN